MLLHHFATFLVAVIGGVVQLNRESDDQLRLYAQPCPCFTAWRSLDVRWSLLKTSCAVVAYNLSWATLSAACAAVGGVLAWFFGYTYLRVPLDDYHFDQMTHNDAPTGASRARGPSSPFTAGAPPSPTPRPKKWCPRGRGCGAPRSTGPTARQPLSRPGHRVVQVEFSAPDERVPDDGGKEDPEEGREPVAGDQRRDGEDQEDDGDDEARGVVRHLAVADEARSIPSP